VLETQLKVLEFRLQELQMRYTVQWLDDHVQAAILKDEIAVIDESLARVRERIAALTIRSRADGTFTVAQAENLPGQFVRQGAQLAYVLDLTTLTARVVIPQEKIALVRHHTRSVELRLAERLADPIPAVIRREVPAATSELPSMALSNQGGGDIAIDPLDAQRMRALQALFQFDLESSTRSDVVNVGGRVYVRFDHGWEPLAQRWYRQIRRLFLSKFHV
jgi:putative peptide zinc metalloprotease protein